MQHIQINRLWRWLRGACPTCGSHMQHYNGDISTRWCIRCEQENPDE